MENNKISHYDKLYFPEDTKESINNKDIETKKYRENEDIIENPNYNKNKTYMEKSSLMDNSIFNINNTNSFGESYKLIDEIEESKDILLSFEKDKNIFNQSQEEDLISEKSKKNIEIKYLKPKQWKYLYKMNFDEIDNQFIMIKNKLNKEHIKEIISKLNNKTIDSLYKIETKSVIEYKINDIQNFDTMINILKLGSISQEKDFNDEKEKLKEYIYKYRYIFKDNNNFYRCIIFSFLENIILTNNYMFLKELLIEIDDKISMNNNIIKNNDYLKNEIQLNIHIEFIKELLYILIKYMTKNINQSYEIFIKIYLLYDDFDYGMIFIIRYLLYEYINENKYLIYSEENKIEISELLPSKYKSMHITIDKKYNLFYLNELFKMKSYDCKIIYYLIPYYFDINLKIITYYENSDNHIYNKCYREEKDKYTVELFSYKGNFDIIYNKKYYEFNSKILNIFENKHKNNLIKKNSFNNNNNAQNNIIENENLKNNDIDILEKSDINNKDFICDICQKEYKGKENILKMCPKCLEEEFKIDILKLYGLYLQYVDHNYKNYEFQINKYFRSIIHTIKIKDITIYDAMNNTGYLVYDILKEVKKDICIICRNDTTKNYYYQLPCNCRFCSKKCFKKYIDIIIYKDLEKIDKNDFKRQIFVFDFCICGKRYYYDDLLILYNYFKNKNKIKKCEILIKIVQNRWKWRCIKCDKNFDPFCLNYRLSLSDPKINKDFYNKEIRHLICSDCYDLIAINKIKNVKCFFCKSEHIILDSIRLNYENKSGDLCCFI